MKGSGQRLILLGLLAALGSVAIQMVVPALPQIASSLGSRSDTTQLVIGTYLGSLAIGQLAWATMVDLKGRRPVLIAGMVLFIAATAICAVATSITVLLIARCLQAFGAAGTLVACRMIASDAAGQGKRAGAMATLSSIVLISPALAPSIGGFVASQFGWRAIFALLFIAGAIFLVLAVFALPESRRQAQPFGGSLWSSYGRLAANRRFLRLACCNAMLTSSLYLFLGVGPFFFADSGFAANRTGLAMSTIALGLICGTIAVPWIERAWPSLLRKVASGVLILGALAMIVVALALPSVTAVTGVMIVIGVGSGMSSPALLADTIELAAERAGLASSLFGALQMLTAALVSSLAAQAHPNLPATALGIAMLVGAATLLRPSRAA
jgi:DHA1 family bicyclomycin/chloramphenicol resistance-like MFS transporter